MALKLLQPGVQPLGQYDGLDTEINTLMGGEIVSFTSIVATSATDKAAHDVFDGYLNPNKRVVVTRNTDGYQSAKLPLMLADDGITGYGTLFGSVLGGTVGQTQTGAVIGPHTTTGSGKVTLWDKPGLYAVSLDAACDQAADGLVPENATLATGSPLTYVPASSTVGGQLTPVGSTAAAGNILVVGRFVEFATNGALVKTPNYLVSSLAGAKHYEFAVFNFTPPRKI
jgi:hypothetical protein